MVAPTDLAAAVLVVGVGLAGAYDLATREVPDNIWRVTAILGAAIGALTLYSPGELLPVLLWVIVAAYAVQHFFPWTDRLPHASERTEARTDLVLGALVVLVVTGAAVAYGVGPSSVPYSVIAALVVTVAARALYEGRLLAGGADAKALITIGVVLPVFPTSAIGMGPASTAFLQIVPFAFNALVDAAVLSLVVPLALGFRNWRRREFHWRTGFTAYRLPVDELPQRFVWVHDPTLLGSPVGEVEPDSSEADQAARERQAEALRERGVGRVWVTPQVPFVFFLALGVFVALAAGNLVWDLVVALA